MQENFFIVNCLLLYITMWLSESPFNVKQGWKQNFESLLATAVFHQDNARSRTSLTKLNILYFIFTKRSVLMNDRIFVKIIAISCATSFSTSI